MFKYKDVMIIDRLARREIILKATRNKYLNYFIEIILYKKFKYKIKKHKDNKSEKNYLSI